MNKAVERIKNGVITENPTFVQILGMCPTLAVTTSAFNGLGMGLSTMVILILSNLMISALRNVIPNRVRIPAYIVIVASFVTIVDFLLQAFLPELSESLGSYIKLIVVNCIILGRAESYASKNPVFPSIFDGVGMGLGFTVGLTSIGLVREILGAGTVFGITIPGYQPIGIFGLAPGAFIVLAFLIAFLNAGKLKKAKEEGNEDTICRIEDCTHCGNTACGGKFFDFDAEQEPKKSEKSQKAEEIQQNKKSEKADEQKKEEASQKAEELKKTEESENAEEPKQAEESKNAEESKKAEEPKQAEELKQAEEAEKAEELKKTEESEKNEGLQESEDKEQSEADVNKEQEVEAHE